MLTPHLLSIVTTIDLWHAKASKGRFSINANAHISTYLDKSHFTTNNHIVRPVTPAVCTALSSFSRVSVIHFVGILVPTWRHVNN
jgi:hypothetical protein